MSGDRASAQRGPSGGVRRAAYFLIAPLVCLAVFWRAPMTWFLMDDFAWLSLRLNIHGARDLLHEMFTPAAQGTVRVLSERLYFIVLSSLFGLHAFPFRAAALLTWFADLGLAAAIGARVTGSRAAGLLAAILWTTSAVVIMPLVWASAYNELLCGLCLLGAFYARLRWLESGERKWVAVEWAAYLAGFGALEVTVMYPAVALLYGLTVNRKKVWSSLPLFVPAALFVTLHLFAIPKPAIKEYAIVVDHRMAGTFVSYLGWVFGPTLMGEMVADAWRVPGIVVTSLVGLALAAFAIRRLMRKDLVPLFFCGWFVLLLGPVLPLPNHIVDYYPTLALLGFAWLAGWGIAAAWNSGGAPRWAAAVVAGLYLTGSIAEIELVTAWEYKLTDRLSSLVLGVRQEIQQHPGTTVLLTGVDTDLFGAGFKDDPFRTIGATVYLVPGAERLIRPRDPEDLKRYKISSEEAIQLFDRGQARVLGVSEQGAEDATSTYLIGMNAQYLASHRSFVDVGNPRFATRIGPSWYPAENGFRWMPKSATVRLAGPSGPGEKLYVTGYAPAPLFASGPVGLRFLANGREIGKSVLSQPGERFALEFPMPGDLVGEYAVEIGIEVSKVLRTEGDPRELGMIFGTFAVR